MPVAFEEMKQVAGGTFYGSGMSGVWAKFRYTAPTTGSSTSTTASPPGTTTGISIPTDGGYSALESQTSGTPPPPTTGSTGGPTGTNDHHRYVLVPQGSTYLAVPQPEPTSRTQVTFTENFYGSSITLVGYEIFEGEQFRIKNLSQGQVDLYIRHKGPVLGPESA